MIEPEIVGQQQRAEFAHKSWPARPSELGSIRAEVRGWLAPLSLTESARQDLVLAVSEAATNAIEHAHPRAVPGDTVELAFWTEPHLVCIEIVDHGEWRPPPGHPTGRGLGIPIMQRLVESVAIHYDARGTRVLLSHPLPGGARVVPATGVNLPLI
jgi:serine/threonine-protein kinase RsbW